MTVRHVRLSTCDYTGGFFLSASFEEVKDSSVSDSHVLGAFDGGFAFTVPEQLGESEYRVQSSGSPLSQARSGYYVCVRMEPAHVLEALGEEEACRLLSRVLASTPPQTEWGKAWAGVLRALRPCAAAALAVENPAVSRQLPAEAAALYEEEHAMLSETWELL